MIDVKQVKAQWSKLLKQAYASHEIIQAKVGKRYAHSMLLIPSAPKRMRGRVTGIDVLN